MRKSILKISLPIIVLSTFMAACYPGGPEFVEDYDAVFTTIVEPSFDFADTSRKTYHLADTVIVLTTPGTTETSLGVNQQTLLNRVRTNMNALGYTELPDKNDAPNADYVLLLSVNRSDNFFTTWWGGGWGGWGWGWGWGGCCWGPPMTTTQNIQTGDIILELLDARRLNPINQYIPEVWRGHGSGLFRGTSQNLTNRSTRAIDQMFTQSPYLKR